MAGKIFTGVKFFLIFLLISTAFSVAGYMYSAANQSAAGYGLGFSLTLTVIVAVALMVKYRQPIWNFVVHHYFWALGIVIASAITAVTGASLYTSDIYQRSTVALPLLQDYLAETAAAKVMGDSINAGYRTPNASWAKVIKTTETVAGQLAALSVPNKLIDYKIAAVSWNNQIMAAAKNPTTWKKLSAAPGDFKLSLNDGKASEWLDICLQNISALKEFGDNAIGKKDREAMRYIAAKILVQKHWLKGIMHSESVNWLAYAGTPAYAEYVPAYQNGDLYVPGFNAGCVEIPGGPPCPGSRPQRQVPQNYTPTKPATNNPATQNPGTQQSPAKTGAGKTPARTYRAVPIKNAYVPGQNFTYGTDRSVCPGRGSCRPTAYEPAVEKTYGPAVNFAEGKNSAADEWTNGWKDFNSLIPAGETGAPPSWPTIEGGQAVEAGNRGLTIGTDVLTPKLSPRLQIFYNQCQARGGIVGGAGVVKTRLPTTESGYTCEYKYTSPNWGENPCWDFLTYSGGRYLGGNTGCPEWNLMP